MTVLYDARFGRTSRLLLTIAAVGFLLEAGAGRACAARIRPSTIVRTPYGAMPVSFIQYLNAGPTAWSRLTPDIPGHLRLTAEAATGRVAASSLVDYLNWRRDLNPRRFDFFHPRLAALLNEPLPVPVVPVTPQSVIPPLTPPRTQTVVPEPSSWLIGVVLTVAAGAGLRRREKGSAG